MEAKHVLIPKCKCLNFSYLVFANDLMIFTKADKGSLSTVNNCLEIFVEISRLQINRDKSSPIIGSISYDEEDALRQIIGFSMG